MSFTINGMENLTFFLVTLFNLSFWLAWPALALLALRGLRRQPIEDTAKALWAIIILVIPVFGAAAFWIVRPGEENAVG